MSKHEAFIFGYGSLVDQKDRPQARAVNLDGSIRAWNVSMDNSVDIPGYHYFVDPETLVRPNVFVTFLNVILSDSAITATNGLIVPVDVKEFERFDLRERNYDRVDITDRINPIPRHRAYTYVGKVAATKRFDNAVAMGTAVVSRRYSNIIEAGFKAMSEAQLSTYHNTTLPHNLPVIPLKMVKL